MPRPIRLRFLLAPGLSLSSLSFMALYPSPAAVGRCFVDGRRGRAFQPSTRTRCFTLSIMPRTEGVRSEEHTSELQSLMRISYAVFCLKKKQTQESYTINQ